MNTKVTPSVLCLVGLLMAGCGTPRVKVVEPNATPRSKTGPLITQSIDIQDVIGTGTKMIESMRISGVLEKGRQQTVLIGISLIENKTSVRDFNVDMLRNRIMTELQRGGKVQTEMTLRVGGRAEDPLAEEARRKRALETGQPVREPDLYLSGNIQEIYRRVGEKRQTSYTFHLALTDNSGATVWQDDQDIVKLKDRSRMGL